MEELEKLASKMQKHAIELERETQKEELAFKKEVKELGSGFEVSKLTVLFDETDQISGLEFRETNFALHCY